MATATLPRRPRTQRHLLEDFTRATSPYKVDREAGIIFGVKVLGTHSRNGRIYTLEAMQQALPMYEGLAVNVDHPHDSDGKLRPDGYRSTYDVFGTLKRVRVEEDGMRADLHYLKSHPLAERVCEAAERMPERFALSHNAEGAGDTVDGVLIVKQILEVRSVDVVAEPGSVSSLFESRTEKKPMARKQITMRRFLENRIAVTSGRRQDWLKAILEASAAAHCDKLEADDPDAEKTTEADDGNDGEGPDHKKDLMNAFTKMVDSDDEHDQKMVNGIVKYLKGPKDKGGESAPATEEEDEEKKKTTEDIDNKTPSSTTGGALTGANGGKPGSGKDNPPETNDKFESRIRELERKEKARDLMEAAGIQADKEFLSALVLLPEPQMKAMIEREKKRGAGTKGSGARSGYQHIPESKEDKPKATDSKSFLEAICS